MTATKTAFKVHPMVQAFPRPTPEERAALKKSIAEVGVLYPVVALEIGDEEWLIDGWTRSELVAELNKEGVFHAANGRPVELAVAVASGESESDAVRRVFGLNLTRRSLSSWQRACIAVRAAHLYDTYRAKEEGRSLTDEPPAPVEGEEQVEPAVKLAEEAATNRDYVFFAQRLLKVYPDILDQSIAGLLSHPEAKKMAKRRDAGLSDKPDGTPPAAVAVEEVKPVAVDAFKKPVAEDLVPIFQARDQVKSVRKQIKDLQKAVGDICEGPGGKNMSLQAAIADLKNCSTHLASHAPYVPCPYCNGTGKKDTGKKCDNCEDRKFIDHVQFKALPDDMKAAFEASTDEE